jgi:hypothetical protein
VLLTLYKGMTASGNSLLNCVFLNKIRTKAFPFFFYSLRQTRATFFQERIAENGVAHLSRFMGGVHSKKKTRARIMNYTRRRSLAASFCVVLPVPPLLLIFIIRKFALAV